MLLISVAGPAFSQEGNELLKRIDNKLMPESYESYRKLVNIEPNGHPCGGYASEEVFIADGTFADCTINLEPYLDAAHHGGYCEKRQGVQDVPAGKCPFTPPDY